MPPTIDVAGDMLYHHNGYFTFWRYFVCLAYVIARGWMGLLMFGLDLRTVYRALYPVCSRVIIVSAEEKRRRSLKRPIVTNWWCFNLPIGRRWIPLFHDHPAARWITGSALSSKIEGLLGITWSFAEDIAACRRSVYYRRGLATNDSEHNAMCQLWKSTGLALRVCVGSLLLSLASFLLLMTFNMIQPSEESGYDCWSGVIYKYSLDSPLC